MNRLLGLGFLAFLLGCASEGVGIDVEMPDASPLNTAAPRRGVGYDAGTAPDLLPGAPDTLAILDATPTPDIISTSDVIAALDTHAPDVIAAPDTISSPDTITPRDLGVADVTPISDAKVLPDGLSYPHDIAPVPATPTTCMRQVIANGYASDKASCATWEIKLNETYIAEHPEYTGPRTSQAACVFIIDCFAAKPDVYTNWYKQPDCDCTCPIPFKGSPDWTQLMSIVSPFCPTFFQAPT
jgi:hypothetical protein